MADSTATIALVVLWVWTGLNLLAIGRGLVARAFQRSWVVGWLYVAVVMIWWPLLIYRAARDVAGAKLVDAWLNELSKPDQGQPAPSGFSVIQPGTFDRNGVEIGH